MSELNETLPAISVIIPVYNAEKYIQQCLSSILIQTFQDYEVIVVDDCSTDDSIKIIELMMPIFKDKLKLIKRSKNSGSPAIPRNIGMRCSRGKYISFQEVNIFLLLIMTMYLLKILFLGIGLYGINYSGEVLLLKIILNFQI